MASFCFSQLSEPKIYLNEKIIILLCRSSKAKFMALEGLSSGYRSSFLTILFSYIDIYLFGCMTSNFLTEFYLMYPDPREKSLILSSLKDALNGLSAKMFLG
jgi:hypothetical protein